MYAIVCYRLFAQLESRLWGRDQRDQLVPPKGKQVMNCFWQSLKFAISSAIGMVVVETYAQSIFLRWDNKEYKMAAPGKSDMCM